MALPFTEDFQPFGQLNCVPTRGNRTDLLTELLLVNATVLLRLNLFLLLFFFFNVFLSGITEENVEKSLRACNTTLKCFIFRPEKKQNKKKQGHVNRQVEAVIRTEIWFSSATKQMVTNGKGLCSGPVVNSVPSPMTINNVSLQTICRNRGKWWTSEADVTS